MTTTTEKYIIRTHTHTPALAVSVLSLNFIFENVKFVVVVAVGNPKRQLITVNVNEKCGNATTKHTHTQSHTHRDNHR